jgi:hypothetical protein
MSRQRRWERLLANKRFDPETVMGQLASSVLDALPPGGKVLLILDETACGKRMECLKLSLAWNRRALPLAFSCYRPDHPPVVMPRLIRRLLKRVAASLPPGMDVTLLADRGLAWPAVIDACRRLGWHWALRIQGQTAIRLADGRRCQARDLAPRRNCKGFRGIVQAFRAAGWRKVAFSASWPKHARDRWLVVGDPDADIGRCAAYGKRVWCEQMHKDEKSGGFGWRESLVRDPEHAARLLKHAARLLTVMALAMLACLSVGSHVLRHGLRRLLEPTRRRLFSIFRLGMRALAEWTQTHPELLGRLYLYPT